jgi:hypothetical protein
MQIFRGNGIGKCRGTLVEEEWVVPKISAPLDSLELALIPCSKGVIICKALAFFFHIFSWNNVYLTKYLMKKRGKNRQCILKRKMVIGTSVSFFKRQGFCGHYSTKPSL